MNQVLAIHHVSLLVSDTARALGFYHGVLGLPVSEDRPLLGFPGAWLQVGEQQIHLIELPAGAGAAPAAVHGGRERHFALYVTELDAICSVLENRGIGYTLSRSGRRALFCRDPDGNAVELIEIER